MFAAIPPLMLVAIISCATVERRVRVPVLSGEPLEIRHVRVLLGLSTETQPIDISSEGEVFVYSGEIVPQLQEEASLDGAQVGLSRRGHITTGGVDWGLPAIVIMPREGESILVGSTVYPGYLVLSKRGKAVQVVNWVKMEPYVAGVVSSEVPAYFSRASCEAQAVAARTYALAEMRRRRLLLYDVTDDQSSQVYRGSSGTRSYGVQAARRTRGVVMVYDWKFLNAFYFSTCGGHTAPASQLSGAPRIEPFEGVECDYCKDSPKYKWAKTMPVAEVEEALAVAGYVSGSLQDIKVAGTTKGGWADLVEVVSTEGSRRLSGNAFRRLLGTSSFYSSKFDIRRSGDEFIIQGRGYGHGVGMCQWGAHGLGRAGRTYAEILRYYYSGAELVKIY